MHQNTRTVRRLETLDEAIQRVLREGADFRRPLNRADHVETLFMLFDPGRHALRAVLESFGMEHVRGFTAHHGLEIMTALESELRRQVLSR